MSVQQHKLHIHTYMRAMKLRIIKECIVTYLLYNNCLRTNATLAPPAGDMSHQAATTGQPCLKYLSSNVHQ